MTEHIKDEYIVTFQTNKQDVEGRPICRITGIIHFIDRLYRGIMPAPGEAWKVKVTGRAASGTYGFIIPVQYLCEDYLPNEYRIEEVQMDDIENAVGLSLSQAEQMDWFGYYPVIDDTGIITRIVDADNVPEHLSMLLDHIGRVDGSHGIDYLMEPEDWYKTLPDNVPLSRYEVIEDNGGGLTLFVFDGNNVARHAFPNLEYLSHDDFMSGLDQLEAEWDISDWEGDFNDPHGLYMQITGYNHGWEVVADCQRDNERDIYPDCMGFAAMEAFGIERTT